MMLKQLMEVYDLLDDSRAGAGSVAGYLKSIRECPIEVRRLEEPGGMKGFTEMIRIRIPGSHGKAAGGTAPTIGILGRLGGLGARPEVTGFVSDGDGALVALTVAAKLLDMQAEGGLPGGGRLCLHPYLSRRSHPAP